MHTNCARITRNRFDERNGEEEIEIESEREREKER